MVWAARRSRSRVVTRRMPKEKQPEAHDLEDVVRDLHFIVRAQVRLLMDKCEDGVFDANDANKVNYLINNVISLDRRKRDVDKEQRDAAVDESKVDELLEQYWAEKNAGPPAHELEPAPRAKGKRR